MALRKLLKDSSVLRELPEDIRDVLGEMEKERRAFEALMEKAEESSGRYDELNGAVARIEDMLQRVTQRVGELEQVEARVTDITNRTETVEARFNDAREGAEAATAETARLGSTLADIRIELEAVLAMKRDLGEVQALQVPVEEIRLQAQQAGDRVTRLTEELNTITGANQEMLRASKEASQRLQQFGQNYQRYVEGLEQAERRLDTVDERIAPLQGAVENLPELRRQLSTLNALSDEVSQKLVTIERHRTMVERALSDAARLDDLSQGLNRQFEEQKQTADFLVGLEAKVGEIKALFETLTAQGEDLSSEHRKLRADMDQQVGTLSTMRNELLGDIRETVDRFEFERQELTTASKEIADLTQAVARIEERFTNLDDKSRTAAMLEERYERLAGEMERSAHQLEDLESEAETAQRVKAELARLDRLTEEMSARIESIEVPIMTSVEKAEERVRSIESAVGSLEGRAENLGDLAERATRLGRELDQRHAALEEAVASLDRVQELREEAVQHERGMEERTEVLTGQLTGADERLNELTVLLTDIQGRTEQLQHSQQRVVQLERRLSRWEANEERLGGVLEQFESRRATIEELQEKLERFFTRVSETTEAVREIAAARGEVEAERIRMQEAMAEMRGASEDAAQIRERLKQVEEAETRLGRAEAVLVEIDSALGAAQNQRSFLDQVLSAVGTLEVEVKQAELLVSSLRDERERIVKARGQRPAEQGTNGTNPANGAERDAEPHEDDDPVFII